MPKQITDLAAATLANVADLLLLRQGGMDKQIRFDALMQIIATGSTTVRSLADRFGEVINVKNKGAVGNGIADDTTAIQNAIDAASNGAVLYCPPSVYSVSDLTVPADTYLNILAYGAEFKARAGTGTILSLASDITRGGQRSILGLRLNGNSIANVIGLKSGDTTSAVLYANLQDMFVKNCAVGIDLYSAMEHTLTNVTCYLNTIGLKLRQDATNGGGNANAFIRCAFQQNAIGMIYDKTSPYPMANNAFYGSIFQSNTLCGFAAFDADDGLECTGTHFEANGTAGTTLAVDGRTIYKCGIQLDNAKLSIIDAVLGENSADPAIKLLNGATLRLTNAYGYGIQSGTFIDGTLNESVELYGHFAGIGLIKVHVARWPDTFTSGSIFSAIGDPVVHPTARVVNEFAASSPTTPLLENATGATINANAGDGEMGMVSNVTYLASAGSTGANFITINAIPSVTTDDVVIISLLVKASVPTNIVAITANAGELNTSYQGPIDTKWRRVVICGVAVANGTPLLFVYPSSSEGATVYFAKLHTLRIASGGDMQKISEMVSRGLFNNNQNAFHYTAAPTVGTWKRGDLVWNTAPASGGAPGWICTTAGTPGTWKAMANLA